jgi:deoxyribonuclease V
MRIRSLHRWDLTPREAIQLQKRLRQRIRKSGRLTIKHIRFVAGADIAWDVHTRRGYAGVIVYEKRGRRLKEVDRVWAEGSVAFPYVPGLLSFREGPLLLEAFKRLRVEPDVIFFDGHGIAHPRRVGLASHLGLFLGKPTIGCAKSRLVGEYVEPTDRPGQWTPLIDRGETVGGVLRTQAGSKPVFISVGHRVNLEDALKVTLACVDGFRIPRPTREADRLVNELRDQAAKS